jgi:enamine deaminase RidA (YjgF/YER057c/UK114 family)
MRHSSNKAYRGKNGENRLRENIKRSMPRCAPVWHKVHQRLVRTGAVMSDDYETRLASLGLTLPEARPPVANYIPYRLTGGLLYISGQVSMTADEAVKGKLGADLSIEDGQRGARIACLNILAQVKLALGSFDRVTEAVRLTGYVNATPDFADHPKVVNGASDLLVAVLGDKGRHTRAAFGVSSLPLGAAVEADAIFAVS